MWVRTVLSAARRAISTSAVDRSTLLAGVALSFAAAAVGLGTVYLLFAKAESLGGWTRSQAVVLYGIYIAFDGLAGAFLSPALAKLPEQIKSGEFDATLLNPAGPQLLLTVGQMNPWRLPDVAVGGLLAALYVDAAPVHLGGTVAALLAALALLYAYWLLVLSLTLSVSRNDNAAQLLVVPLSLGRFPLGVYPLWLKALLLSVLPVGFITFVPAAVLSNVLPPGWAAVAVAVAAAAVALSNRVFRHCTYQYTGA